MGASSACSVLERSDDRDDRAEREGQGEGEMDWMHPCVEIAVGISIGGHESEGERGGRLLSHQTITASIGQRCLFVPHISDCCCCCSLFEWSVS